MVMPTSRYRCSYKIDFIETTIFSKTFDPRYTVMVPGYLVSAILVGNNVQKSGLLANMTQRDQDTILELGFGRWRLYTIIMIGQWHTVLVTRYFGYCNSRWRLARKIFAESDG